MHLDILLSLVMILLVYVHTRHFLRDHCFSFQTFCLQYLQSKSLLLGKLLFDLLPELFLARALRFK
jgi:hypothetical protein